VNSNHLASPQAQPLPTRARTLLAALTNNPQAAFHTGQYQAIEALVAHRRRVLVVQRTGWGKSAVYFIAALLLRDDAYRCLVFTPLTAALFFLVAPIAATIFLVRQIIPPALRALRSGQYPPPGEKTLVRTRIRYGRAARISIWLELVLIPLWALFLLAGSVPALYQIAGKPCPAAGSQQAQAGIYSAAAIREKPAM